MKFEYPLNSQVVTNIAHHGYWASHMPDWQLLPSHNIQWSPPPRLSVQHLKEFNIVSLNLLRRQYFMLLNANVEQNLLRRSAVAIRGQRVIVTSVKKYNLKRNLKFNYIISRISHGQFVSARHQFSSQIQQIMRSSGKLRVDSGLGIALLRPKSPSKVIHLRTIMAGPMTSAPT